MRPCSFRQAAAVCLPACLAVCLFGLAVGCDAENTSSGATTVSVSTLVADLATAFCTRCATTGGTSATASPCSARASVAIREQLALVATAVDEGLISIGATPEMTCISDYMMSACEAPPPATPNVQTALAGCSGLLTGYVPAGERCDMSAECVAQSFCLSQGASPQNVTSLSGSGTLGVCFAYQEQGAPCNATADCDPGPPLTCDPTTLTCLM
jgi:hypothetical protein